MSKESLIAILFLVTCVGESSLVACQCQRTTNKFSTHLSRYGFVGLVEIIGYDSINDHDFDHPFTIVRVLKQYNKGKLFDTISVVDGSGASCYIGLPSRELGAKFIIKASLDSKAEYEVNFTDLVSGIQAEEGNERVLVLSLCDENTLVVQGDSIEGNITRKSSYKKACLDEGKNIVKIEFTRKGERFGYYVTRQKMSVSRVEGIIRRRLNR